MYKFQEQVLKDALCKLCAESRVAFAASCAQRLIGAYRAFAEHVGRSASDLESALEYVWTHVLVETHKDEIERRLADVISLVPKEGEQGWTPSVAYAEDAVAAVACCLRCLLSNKVQYAAWSARRVYDALDLFVTTRDDIAFVDVGAEARILRDPVIQAELRRQERDIADLQVGECLSSDLLGMLRIRSVADQVIVLHG